MAEDTPDTHEGNGLSRRDLLTKAGVVGAGAIAAGSLAGGATAASKRSFATPTPRRGGTSPSARVRSGGGGPVRHGAGRGALGQGGHLRLTGGVRPGPEHQAGSRDVVEGGQEGGHLHPPQGGAVPQRQGADGGRRRLLRHEHEEPAAARVPDGRSERPGDHHGRSGPLEVSGAARPVGAGRRVPGFFAWQRYGPIVPEGLYDQINVARQAIGTGPYRLVNFTPLDRVELVRNERFWKPGQPYMNGINLKVMTDEQARVAALRAGAIDGATLSVDVARSLRGVGNLQVLSGLNAAFRELQMTLKPGRNEPWADKRVRQAVNFAINRQQIIQNVYSGEAAYTSYVPPGYGPWPLSEADLKRKYAKFDLPAAKKLMADAERPEASPST